MTFRKKTIVMAVAFCVTFVVGAISLVSIFAISTLVGQKANVSLTYSVVKSKNYTGVISLWLKKAGESTFTCIDDGIGFNKGVSGTVNTSSITSDDIELTETCTNFTLCWVISNNTEDSKYYEKEDFLASFAYEDTGDTDAQVTVSGNSSSGLISLSSASLPKNPQSYLPSLYSKGLGNKTFFSNSTIKLGCTYLYFIQVSLADKYQDAVFNGDFIWTITDAT